VRFNKYFLYALLIIFNLVWILPIWPTILVACKTNIDFTRQAFWQLPTRMAFWENAVEAWTTAQLGVYFINSLLYGLAGSLGAILFSSLAGFALARLRLKGSYWWFLLIWSGTIFPFQMYVIPLFKFYNMWGLYDTRIGMILFYMAICIPFCVFIFRNYFITISFPIQEAATLDGCSSFGIYWRIFMPQAKPAIAVLILFQFTWIWNDLLFGMILTRSPLTRPIMVGLARLQGFRAGTGTNVPSLMAGAVLGSLPTILLFVGLLRYFIEGLRLSGAGE